MKVLVICQYYYPEPFRVNDICEEMVKRGHEVTVVTGEPNYPEGQIYNGYERHANSDEVINGVTVHRCPIIPRKTDSLHRFLNYFSYPIAAKRYVDGILTSTVNPFDVVFVNQLSPVMMAMPAIEYKKKSGIPVVMYCLDLWPESLVAGGIARSSLIYRFFHRLSKNIYRQMDRILVTSRMFRGYLMEEFGIEDERIDYLPQYAEGIFKQIPYVEDGENINLVFAGNVGEIQSVETVVKAAERLQEKPVQFHIVGGGTDLNRLIKIATGLNNITFYGRRPLEEMPLFYAKADAMLVTLKADPVLSLTLPGKVQSYMAVGKPIIGAINGETAEVIREAKCGYCSAAEDVDGLVEIINRFMVDDKKEQMCTNSRNYYDKYFDRSRFMDTLCEELALTSK